MKSALSSHIDQRSSIQKSNIQLPIVIQTKMKSALLCHIYRLEIIISEIEYLVAHCHSNDNDFGKQNLTINTSIYWKFRRNFFETSRFYCKFWWKTSDDLIYKETEFEVFNNHIADDECGNKLTKMNRCFWSVTQVGFYFAKGSPSSWMLKYPW